MFIVTKRFGRSESRLKDFINQVDAEKFIQESLADDIRFKLNATYGLYEGSDILKEFTQKDYIDTTSASSTNADASSQGAGQRSSFSPTPFNTAPRPARMPQHWRKDEDDKNK